MQHDSNNVKEIYLAGGCFWGTEHFFKQIEGVVETEVGYANGHTEHPTYKEVCTDKTGFAETVRVVYDPEKIGLRFLLKMYFKAIDPVSVNRQGHDTARNTALASIIRTQATCLLSKKFTVKSRNSTRNRLP